MLLGQTAGLASLPGSWLTFNSLNGSFEYFGMSLEEIRALLSHENVR